MSMLLLCMHGRGIPRVILARPWRPPAARPITDALLWMLMEVATGETHMCLTLAHANPGASPANRMFRAEHSGRARCISGMDCPGVALPGTSFGTTPNLATTTTHPARH